MLSLVLLALNVVPAILAAPTPVGSAYPVATESVVTTYTYAAASDPGAPTVTAAVAGLSPAGNPDVNPPTTKGRYKSALLISFDGFHASDLTNYIKQFPKSNLADIVSRGVNFKNAKTSSPSDSFPGTNAYLTGASSRTHGVYCDVSYDRELYAPGTNCVGPRGYAVAFDETLDLNSTDVSGGGGLNETNLPMFKTNWGTCAPVYPWNYVRVNNIFEVARFSGLQTAYSDKHPAYTFANGPSGFGLSEGYFPEINAFSTQSEVESYDDLHWNTLNNWASGKHFNGSVWAALNGGSPAIFGANFQSVSVSEESPGCNIDGTPSAQLLQAMTYLDGKLSGLIATMRKSKTYQSTLLVLTAKHGQAPIARSTLRWINADSLVNATGVDVPGSAADDGAYLWLANATDAPLAKANLLANKAALGITDVWIWPELMANGFGDPRFDSRAPDVVVKTLPGVIYTSGGPNKSAQHGGLNADDVDVVLLVHNPEFSSKSTSDNIRISTRSVAPTILQALGLDPMYLEGVRKESTPVLPGVPM